MRARFAFDGFRRRAAGAALAIGAFAAACGKIGYDPELVGGQGETPDASIDASHPDVEPGARDGAPDERARPPSDVAIEDAIDEGASRDADAIADADADATASDAS